MAIIYNKVINKPKMENIKNKLGLGAEVTETEIVNSIDVLQNKANELESENQKLKEEIAKYEAEQKEKEAAEKAAFETEVNEFVNGAVKDGKIKEEEKEGVLANALVSKESFGFVKNMISKISNVVVAPKIFNLAEVETSLGIENRKDWTIRDWEKKDPNGLLKLKNEAPVVYAKLFKDTYNVEPNL